MPKRVKKIKPMFLYELQQLSYLASGLKRMERQPVRVMGEDASKLSWDIKYARMIGDIKGKSRFHNTVRAYHVEASAGDGQPVGIDIDVADALDACVEEIYRLRGKVDCLEYKLKYGIESSSAHRY